MKIIKKTNAGKHKTQSQKILSRYIDGGLISTPLKEVHFHFSKATVSKIR
jgi:hypothetical protein